MSYAVIQLLLLAGFAVFLIMRLRNVLGTRDGFEKPPLSNAPSERSANRRDFEVIEGGAEADITDYVPEGSPSAKALTEMKTAEPGFMVGEFLSGAKGAYEMILMAFEKGDIASIAPFLSDEVRDTFAQVVERREAEGLKIDAQFVGLRDIGVTEAEFDTKTGEAEITVRFLGELHSVVRNASGEIIEGNPNEIRRQKDVWTFARHMGADDPNWKLVATGG